MVECLDLLKYDSVEQLFCVLYLFQYKTVSPLGCKHIRYLNSRDLIKSHRDRQMLMFLCLELKLPSSG